jgi:hypothetical protein
MEISTGKLSTKTTRTWMSSHPPPKAHTHPSHCTDLGSLHGMAAATLAPNSASSAATLAGSSSGFVPGGASVTLERRLGARGGCRSEPSLSLLASLWLPTSLPTSLSSSESRMTATGAGGGSSERFTSGSVSTGLPSLVRVWKYSTHRWRGGEAAGVHKMLLMGYKQTCALQHGAEPYSRQGSKRQKSPTVIASLWSNSQLTSQASAHAPAIWVSKAMAASTKKLVASNTASGLQRSTETKV